MRSSGVIYSRRRQKFWLRAGNSLFFVSLGILMYLFLPIGLVELRYALQSKEEPAHAITEASVADPVVSEAKAHGLSSYFSIFIPKIDAKAKIIPNVDAASPADYKTALMEGVAHTRGTYFPGQGQNIFLFAHSTDSPLNFTRYNAVFYLLNRLVTGDEIVLYFLDKKYIYVVRGMVVADPSDVSWLTKNFGTESLILQTCDPPGTTRHRLLVVATLKP